MVPIKILTVGDPHIRGKFCDRSRAMMDQIIDLIKMIKPAAVVVLGDTLHDHNRMDTNPHSRATRFLARIAELTKLILLIGNHDILNDETFILKADDTEHPFVALHYWPNTVVCDIPTIFEVEGYQMIGMPYVPPGKFHTALSEVATPEDINNYAAVFSHNHFHGVRYNLTDKEPAECPDSWPENYPLNIAGHNHTKQEVAPNLKFVGTPIQHSYGEDEDKSISVFEFNDESGALIIDHQEYRLEIPKLREYKIEVSELEETLNQIRVLQHDLYHFKVSITDNISSLKEMRKWNIFHELKNMENVSIVQSGSTDNDVLIRDILIPTSDFTEILRNKIEHDSYLMNLAKRYLPEFEEQLILDLG